MIPIKFPEANVTFAKDQPEYNLLPAYIDKGPAGDVISCWRLSFAERLRILFTGKIWLSLWCFHQPLTPSRLTTKKSEFLIERKEIPEVEDEDFAA